MYGSSGSLKHVYMWDGVSWSDLQDVRPGRPRGWPIIADFFASELLGASAYAIYFVRQSPGRFMEARGEVDREDVHGGSVMIASNSPPHLQGCCVMSNVHRSTIRCATPYRAAWRITPGILAFEQVSQESVSTWTRG